MTKESAIQRIVALSFKDGLNRAEQTAREEKVRKELQGMSKKKVIETWLEVG